MVYSPKLTNPWAAWYDILFRSIFLLPESLILKSRKEQIEISKEPRNYCKILDLFICFMIKYKKVVHKPKNKLIMYKAYIIVYCAITFLTSNDAISHNRPQSTRCLSKSDLQHCIGGFVIWVKHWSISYTNMSATSPSILHIYECTRIHTTHIRVHPHPY